jgi:hypothetical protein
LVLPAVSVVSAFDTSAVITSGLVPVVVTVVVGHTVDTLTTDTLSAARTGDLLCTVHAHGLVTADLTVAAVSVVLAPDADVVVADSTIVTVATVGTFDTLLVVTHAVTLAVS